MKKIKIALFVILAILFIGIGLAIGLRERIMHGVIDRVITSQKERNKITIAIKQAKFEGLSTVVMNEISILPDSLDTLLSVSHFKVKVELLPMLIGRIKLSELVVSGANLQLINQAGKRNFEFLLKSKKKDTLNNTNQKIDLAHLADNLINDLLYKVPARLDIQGCHLKVVDNKHQFQVAAKAIQILNNRFYSTFILNQNESVWHAEGYVNPEAKKLNMQFYAENKKVEFPYLEEKFGLKLNFDTISTRMDAIDYKSGNLSISGNWHIHNLMIKHPKLAQKEVVVSSAAIDCKMLIGENFVAIDSSSVASLGEIKIHPFLKYTIAPQKIYELKINTEKTLAQKFLNSFPQGLFESLEGIKVAGNLAYHLNFYLDSKDPWHCKFDSKLSRENFKILQYGNVNFQKINSSFIYTAFEGGNAVKSMIVGPESFGFTPYAQISDYIKNALLTSEDPLFFSHRGFYEEAFRQSIATNFVAGRFKRGGSTISMQLVKNIFLNRNKTVARKLEEVLIVWMIENGRLVDKQRMFEVYLNIIEWGPNVYGITEASRFYFDKFPSELNLGESIFLASIVPKPKRFKNSFLTNAELKPYMHKYFKLIGGLMVRRGKVPATDTVGIFNSVKVKGLAKSMILVVDTLPPALAEEITEVL
jgi:Transglycosylase